MPRKMTLGQLAVECRREGPHVAQTLLQRHGDSCEEWSRSGSVKDASLGSVVDFVCRPEQDTHSEQLPLGMCDVFQPSAARPPAAPPGSSSSDLPAQPAEFVTPSPPQARPLMPATMWSTPECPPPPPWSAAAPTSHGHIDLVGGSSAAGKPAFQQVDHGSVARTAWEEPPQDFWALGQQHGAAPPQRQAAPMHKLASTTPGAPAAQMPRSAPGVPPGVFVVNRPTGPRQPPPLQRAPKAPHRGGPGARGADAIARQRFPKGAKHRAEPSETLPVGRLGLLAGHPRLGGEAALTVQPPAAGPSVGRSVAPR